MFDQFRNDAVYNTRAVVQRTGVPADTIRAWERRYDLPVPKRTAGNQRLYSERDIATIAWLRDQTREGLTISQAVALFRSNENQLSNPVGRAESPSATTTLGESDHTSSAYDQFRRRLVQSMLRFDGAEAERTVEDALAMLSVEDVCLFVLSGALVDIGELWQRGEATIATEHFASRFVQRKLSALFNSSTPDDGAGPVLASCVAGEQHEIGLLLTSLFLSRRGYLVIYLGADVPNEDINRAVFDVKPAFVLLSSSTELTVDSLRSAAEELATINESLPAREKFVVGYGGRIFECDPTLRESIPAEYLGANARETVASVNSAMITQSISRN